MKSATKNGLSFWERHQGEITAVASFVLALLVTAVMALPQFKDLRAAIGLDWEWTGRGFFRDCNLPEYADDEVCVGRRVSDRMDREWTEMRRTKGGNTQFSIP